MTQIARRPLYFGDASSPAFGWYHARSTDSGGALTAVICPPLGHEYVHSHRSVRVLADALADAGIPALRFDYAGTGDAPGGDGDPNRVAVWLRSIVAAIETARATSGRPGIVLIGIRFGALLAAITARTIPVDGLALWAPCVRGRAYVRELRAIERTTVGAAETQGDVADLQVGGFVMTQETQSVVSTLSLDDQTLARRVLIVGRDDVPDSTQAIETRWNALGIAVDRRSPPGFAEMMLAPHNSRVPYAAVSDIVQWTSSLDPSEPCEAAAPAAVNSTACEIAGVRETYLRFGTSVKLFGILSVPESESVQDAPVVVLPNSGSAHHVGPGRLHVTLARELSRAGFRCLRFDFPGLGDSMADDPARDNVPYPADANAIVASALDDLRDQGIGASFIVMGLCSGAHTAFHAAVDLPNQPIVEAVSINPLTFYYTPGMPLDESQSAHVTQWQRYMRSIASLQGWSKLFREDTHFSHIVADVFERIRIISRSTVDELRLLHDSEVLPRTQLEVDIQAILRQGRRLTFVFSRFDPGYDLLMIGAGRVVKRLVKRGDIKIWRVRGANHTFDAPGPRAEMIRWLTGYLAERYLKRAPAGISNSRAYPARSSLPWTAA